MRQAFDLVNEIGDHVADRIRLIQAIQREAAEEGAREFLVRATASSDYRCRRFPALEVLTMLTATEKQGLKESQEAIYRPVKRSHILGGTARGVLQDSIGEALSGLRDAMQTLQATAPNGRDYNAESFDRATIAHLSRMARIMSCANELDLMFQELDAEPSA